MRVTTILALSLILAAAVAGQGIDLDLPPVEFSPQLEVIVEEVGSTLRYQYIVTNPVGSSFPLSLVAVVPVGPLKEARINAELMWELNSAREPDRSAITVSYPVHCSGSFIGPPDEEPPGYSLDCFIKDAWRDNIGQTLPTLTLSSSHPAAVVRVEIKGDHSHVQGEWQERFDYYEAPDAAVDYFERAAFRLHYTIGPMGHQLRSWTHWEYFLESLAKAAELGWFPDAALHAEITDRVVRARQAAGARQVVEARALLAEAEALATAAGEGQLHRFGRLLVVTNAQALRPDLPPRCQTELELEPQWQTFDVGREGVLVARAYNLGDGQPIVGGALEFKVLSGWQEGLTISAVTDAQGLARFVVPAPASPKELEYRVKGDVRPLSPTSGCPLGYVMKEGTFWWAWPERMVDLLITELSPPFVLSGPGREVVINERTGNRGSLPVEVATVTRYFASVSEELDPAQAVVLGERVVEPLRGGGDSDGGERVFVLPAGLPPGRIWLFACADATGMVEEYVEANNCGRSSGMFGPGVVPKLGITAHLPVGVVATPYGGRLVGDGGWAPYRFSVHAGALPPGLVLAENGAITGVPSEAGNFAFTARVEDELALEGQGEYTITITAAHGGAIPAVGRSGVWTLIGLLAAAAAVGLWRGLRA